MRSPHVDHVATWTELKACLSGFTPGWVFRGHAGASWPLATALERTESADRTADEWRMIDHFRRRASLHLPPQLHMTDDDVFGWMALMQHYGAPTRLLDVTRSPYVAAFFALEEPACGDDRDAAIWAIDTAACVRQARSVVADGWRLSADEAERLVEHEHARLVHRLVVPPGCCVPAVFPVEPWRFDPRQSAQQACFLCPGDVTRPIREQLEGVLATPGDRAIIQICFPRTLRQEAIDDLWRMNVSPASLFPSLEGQARALRMLLTQPR